MAFKQFYFEDATPIKIFKRKSSRSLRLSITPKGEIRVSIPAWVSYQQGFSFAKSRELWIKNNQHVPNNLLRQGNAIGKAHHLTFVADPLATKATSRVKSSEITIRYPSHLELTHSSVQSVAEAAGIRALRTQAEQLLPQRLALLAQKHAYQYRSVSVKLLKSRWGSCDQHKNIVLNLFLMQLPWDHIDYVLIHELIHTKVLRHGPVFWETFESVLPGAKRYRKSMRNYQPILHG